MHVIFFLPLPLKSKLYLSQGLNKYFYFRWLAVIFLYGVLLIA